MAAGGEQLTQLRTSLLQAVAQLEGQGWQVAPDGAVSVRPGSPLDVLARISPSNALTIRMLATRETITLKRMLTDFDAADQRTDQTLRQAVSALDSTRDTGGGGTPAPGDKATPPTPSELKSEANLKIQQQDLARVTSAAEKHHVSVEEVQAHPEQYGLTATDIVRYHNANEVQKALKRYRDDAIGSNNEHPPIYLLKYDPEAFGGKGSAAIAIGNPDTADNTTVKVSGLTTSVRAGSMDNPDPVNLYNETSLADPGKSNAVVMWMGYDAPNDQAVAVPNMARHGAELLAADVNALRADHQGTPSHLTVIGHSYGSTTVADAAARYGMRVDDIVLIGSPGTDLAKSAADFHLPPGGHLYVGAASTDPVTYFGREHVNGPGLGLGKDPSIDGFGSTRFHAESSRHDFSTDHSRYFEKGSESLYSMADIASGHGDQLQQHGMTAEHRADHWYTKAPIRIPGTLIPIPGTSATPLGLDQALDPERGRHAHDNHSHTN
ncbi:alpha/beta fold hydrolase [Mycobacterium sp. M1]|uniref:Alpha/beta fold hydrolase n=2 Tax=Mycolicibacter acidiphilus TaxID=2835306 RepID=A0ABS5RIU3_9MYCO|nr:alpha/beta fold hydrolase [Mycolicibacter acidiphilus]